MAFFPEWVGLWRPIIPTAPLPPPLPLLSLLTLHGASGTQSLNPLRRAFLSPVPTPPPGSCVPSCVPFSPGCLHPVQIFAQRRFSPQLPAPHSPVGAAADGGQPPKGRGQGPAQPSTRIHRRAGGEADQAHHSILCHTGVDLNKGFRVTFFVGLNSKP